MEFLNTFLHKLVDWITTYAGKFIAALLVLIIGSIIIKCVVKAMRKRKLKKHEDATLNNFLTNLVKIGLNVVLVVTVIAILGVPTASVITVIASCGVAVGLAMQGSLSNLAGGIMLLIFRPFKLGDFIDADGFSGSVVDIGIFYTTLKTGDNKSITIPNGSLMNSNVTNFSVHDTRRVDFTFSVAYGTDVEKVKAILLEEAGKHEMTFKDPAPFCRLSKQNANGLDFVLRVWVKSSDYWTVNFDLLETINNRFASEGIEIPFSQLDVHVKNK